jgi:hypothetical protein
MAQPDFAFFKWHFTVLMMLEWCECLTEFQFNLALSCVWAG